MKERRTVRRCARRHCRRRRPSGPSRRSPGREGGREGGREYEDGALVKRTEAVDYSLKCFPPSLLTFRTRNDELCFSDSTTRGVGRKNAPSLFLGTVSVLVYPSCPTRLWPQV